LKRTDEIKDNKEKGNLKNNSSINEVSDYSDEVSTFRNVEIKIEVNENGN